MHPFSFLQPVEPAEHSPSTSPFSSPDENDDRDKSWVKPPPSQTHQDDNNSKLAHDHEPKLETSPVVDDSEVVKEDTPKVDDMEWLRNLEEIEKEAFGFIEAQGMQYTEDRPDTKPPEVSHLV